MIIKSHLCGIAVAFDRYEGIQDPEQAELNKLRRSLENGTKANRPQGSLYSWQKRKIADACEYMRVQPVHKPIIFVATSPGFTDLASERSLIKSFTHNLRNGYECKNYVWVREFTEQGYPHFHFVADMPDCDMRALSLYWSGLFGSTARNSIRFGTAPKCSRCGTKLKQKNQPCYKTGCNGFGRVEYYLTKKKMAWYMTKYLTKAIGSSERRALKGKRSFRTFAVSQELTRLSAPVEFKSKMVVTSQREVMRADGKYYPFYEDERVWQNCTSVMTELEVQNKWKWQYTGFANTHKGFPKDWKLKKAPAPPIVETKPEIICPF